MTALQLQEMMEGLDVEELVDQLTRQDLRVGGLALANVSERTWCAQLVRTRSRASV